MQLCHPRTATFWIHVYKHRMMKLLHPKNRLSAKYTHTPLQTIWGISISTRSKSMKWREAIPHNTTITLSVLAKTDQQANMGAESILTFGDKFLMYPCHYAISAVLQTKNPIKTLHLRFVPTRNLQMFSLIRKHQEPFAWKARRASLRMITLALAKRCLTKFHFNKW